MEVLSTTSEEFIEKVKEEMNYTLPTKINVMGTDFDITYTTEEEDPTIKGKSGVCYSLLKKIKIDQYIYLDDADGSVSEAEKSSKLLSLLAILRHEVMHAFFFQSGLDTQCSFAVDEMLIDWLSLKLPEIVEVMKENHLVENRSVEC